MDTLKTLRDEVLYQLDEPNDTGSVKTNTTNALNQAQIQRVTSVDWPFMLWPPATLDPETFTTVSGVKGYSLHQEFSRPYYFRDQGTRIFLIDVPSRNIGPQGMDWIGGTNNNSNFALWGHSALKAQPSSASVLTISSSSASDTGSTKGIIVRGETTDGVTSETINPNGTNAVAGLLSFTRILAITKSSAWAGTLTVTSNAASVTNLKLFPTEYGRNYQQLFFMSPQTGGSVIEYRFYRKPSPLVNDNDIPDIPFPFTKVLVWDALLLLAAYDGRIDGGRISVWRDNQQKLDSAMRQTYLEGNTLEAMPRYVRFIDSEQL